jgi:hypothetical protein
MPYIDPQVARFTLVLYAHENEHPNLFWGCVVPRRRQLPLAL